MKILIIGTLGAGKTTLARALSDETGFPYTSIDGCRIHILMAQLLVKRLHGIISWRLVLIHPRQSLSSQAWVCMPDWFAMHFPARNCRLQSYGLIVPTISVSRELQNGRKTSLHHMPGRQSAILSPLSIPGSRSPGSRYGVPSPRSKR